MERKILGTVGYKINIPTVKDFLNLLFKDENTPRIVLYLAEISAEISQLSYELAQV